MSLNFGSNTLHDVETRKSTLKRGGFCLIKRGNRTAFHLLLIESRRWLFALQVLECIEYGPRKLLHLFMKYIFSIMILMLFAGVGCETVPSKEQSRNKPSIPAVQATASSTSSTKELSQDVAFWKRKTVGPSSPSPEDIFENSIQFSHPPQWDIVTTERIGSGWGKGAVAEVAIGGQPSVDTENDSGTLLADARFYIIEFTPPAGTSPLMYYKNEIIQAKQDRTFIGYKKVDGINGLFTDQGNNMHPGRRWLELPVKNKMIVIVDTTYNEKLFNDFLSTISFNQARKYEF